MSLVGIHVINTGGSTEPIAGVPYDTVMNEMLAVGYEAFIGLHTDLDFLYRASRTNPSSLRQVRWGNETQEGGKPPFDTDPVLLADYIANWYLTVKSAPMGVTPIDHVQRHCTGNEPNLEGEGRFGGRYPGVSADWAGLNEWLAVHYIRLRANMTGRGFIIHFPALAPVGGDEYNGIRACRSALSYCDVLDIHAYGHSRWNWLGVTAGGWQRNSHYSSLWWKDANYGSSFMRYRQILDEMGFSRMPINITEYNRVWYDKAWYDSLSPVTQAPYGTNHYPEETQDAIDYAAEVIEYHRHLDRNRRHYNLLSACGFIWASNDERYRAMSWMRGSVIEPVVAAQRGYIPSDRPIGGGGMPVLPIALVGMAALGLLVVQRRGVL